MFSEFQPETQRRISILLSYVGKTFAECSAALDVNERHAGELDIPLTKRKGSAGNWLEEVLTGKRGDNLCEADDGEWDIKSTNIVSASSRCKYPLSGHLSSYSPKENLRITILNYNDIQTIEYPDSGLRKKSKVLVAFYSAKKPLQDSIFQGFGIIDMSTPKYQQRLSMDYNTFKDVCRRGEAHRIGSAATTGTYIAKKGKDKGKEKEQYGRLVKSYSSDAKSGTVHHYTDAEDNKCTAGGYALYLFKEQLIDVVQIVPPNNC